MASNINRSGSALSPWAIRSAAAAVRSVDGRYEYVWCSSQRKDRWDAVRFWSGRSHGEQTPNRMVNGILTPIIHNREVGRVPSGPCSGSGVVGLEASAKVFGRRSAWQADFNHPGTASVRLEKDRVARATSDPLFQGWEANNGRTIVALKSLWIDPANVRDLFDGRMAFVRSEGKIVYQGWSTSVRVGVRSVKSKKTGKIRDKYGNCEGAERLEDAIIGSVDVMHLIGAYGRSIVRGLPYNVRTHVEKETQIEQNPNNPLGEGLVGEASCSILVRVFEIADKMVKYGFRSVNVHVLIRAAIGRYDAKTVSRLYGPMREAKTFVSRKGTTYVRMIPVRDADGNQVIGWYTVRIGNRLTEQGANRSIRRFATNSDSTGHSGNVRSSVAKGSDGEDFDVTTTIRGLFASAARYGRFDNDSAYTVSVREEAEIAERCLKGTRFQTVTEQIEELYAAPEGLTVRDLFHGLPVDTEQKRMRKIIRKNTPNKSRTPIAEHKPTEPAPTITDLTKTYRERNPNMPKAKKIA